MTTCPTSPPPSKPPVPGLVLHRPSSNGLRLIGAALTAIDLTPGRDKAKAPLPDGRVESSGSF
jgi:hypothetical protein